MGHADGPLPLALSRIVRPARGRLAPAFLASGQRPDELRADQPDEGGVVGPSDPSDVERGRLAGAEGHESGEGGRPHLPVAAPTGTAGRLRATAHPAPVYRAETSAGA